MVWCGWTLHTLCWVNKPDTKDELLMVPLAPGIVSFIETESGMKVTRGQRMGGCCLMDTELLFGMIQRVPEMNGGFTAWKYWALLKAMWHPRHSWKVEVPMWSFWGSSLVISGSASCFPPSLPFSLIFLFFKLSKYDNLYERLGKYRTKLHIVPLYITIIFFTG